MSPFPYSRRVKHPYSHNPLYKHFVGSQFHHPAYSAAAVPFAWMMKEPDTGIPAKAEAYKIGFKPELEPDLEFDKLWVQERRNPADGGWEASNCWYRSRSQSRSTC